MKHCRLTNKALARIGRKHIFHTIRLRQREGFGHAPHPMGRFFKFVRENPSTVGHIRVLEVVSAEEYNDPGPFKLLHLVKNLESFSVAFGHDDYAYRRLWSNIAPEIRSSIEELLRTNALTSLAMTGMNRIPVDLFRRVPLLQDLTLLKVSPRREDSPMPGMPSLGLRSLHLQNGWLDFLPYIGSGDEHLFDISEVTDLEVEGEDASAPELQRRITDMIAIPRKLESLTISAIVYADSRSQWTSCGSIMGSSRLASSVQTLRKLTLKIQTVFASDWDPYVGLLPELVRIQGTNILEEISLTVQSGWDSSLNKDPAAWNELDRVLSTGFPHLRQLNLGFDVSNEGEDAQVTELLARQLPWCHANLHFTSQVEEVIL